MKTVSRAAALVASLCLCLPAHAKKAEPLPMPLAEALPVELVLGQHELGVDVPDTSAAAGAAFGLIGVLINSAIVNAEVKRGEEQVIGIRDQLLEFPFDQRFESSVRQRLPSAGLSFNPTYSTGIVDHTSPDAGLVPSDVLVLTPRYATTPAFNALSVSITADYVHRERKNGKFRQTSLRHRVYTFRSTMPAAGSPEDSAGQWAALGREPLEAILQDCIDQSVDMLVYDFSAEGRADAEDKIRMRDNYTFDAERLPGRMQRSGDDWVWMRQGNGIMQGLTGLRPAAGVVAAVAAAKATTETASVTAVVAEPAGATP